MSVPNPPRCARTLHGGGTLCAVVLVAAVLAACSPTNAPAAVQPSAPTSAAAATSAKNAPKAFPPEDTSFSLGGTKWYVVVALSRTENDPKLASAQRSVTDVGYSGVDIFYVPDCLEGLREGLKLKAVDYYGVALGFGDAATAQEFVDAYQPGVVGTVKVVNQCADDAY